ncbi:MAG: hypothetical protein MUP85_14065 [Candidatus Lokiarchaeota archaeon]|nr:hypothetical protein [Candidatus Lokiarchaeota archaeon]
MEVIKYLGNKLSEFTKISPPGARGLIKLAVKDELGPYKPLQQVTYKELKMTIENALKKRLLSLEINAIDNIIEELLDVLANYQSLIVMENI